MGSLMKRLNWKFVTSAAIALMSLSGCVVERDHGPYTWIMVIGSTAMDTAKRIGAMRTTTTSTATNYCSPRGCRGGGCRD